MTGHEAAGMKGVVNVTGPTMTLEEAEASAKFGKTGAAPAEG